MAVKALVTFTKEFSAVIEAETLEDIRAAARTEAETNLDDWSDPDGGWEISVVEAKAVNGWNTELFVLDGDLLDPAYYQLKRTQALLASGTTPLECIRWLRSDFKLSLEDAKRMLQSARGGHALEAELEAALATEQ